MNKQEIIEEIMNEVWGLLMYSPDGDKERIEYWGARKDDIRGVVLRSLLKFEKGMVIEKVDSIDFFETEEDSVGDKKIKMREDFEAGAIWGWNEARKKLLEK